MRKWLAASVALAPLCMANAAFADTVINTLRNTPIATATAGANNTPDNVKIDTAGSVQVKNGAAITLNSNNTVVQAGNVTMAPASGETATAILVQGGNTGSVSNTGSILIDDGLVATDTNGDGILDGPLAAGLNRYGIQLVGPGAFTGDITNSGGIIVHGNSSAGISLETGLTGNLSSTGSVTVFGDNSFGVHSTAAITGNVTVSNVTTTGGGASGVSLEGDVGGKVLLNGAITTTGYRVTNHLTVDAEAKLDASDKLQGGPAVVIAGSVAKGVVLDAAPVASTTNTDVDGDGVPDTGQATGVITQFGSAPALRIGSAANAITLGQVGTTVSASAADYAYGLILKGTVASNGVLRGVDTTAVDIGFGGKGVNISGGMRIAGQITSLSYGGNATGLQFDAGANVATIANAGSLGVATRGSGTQQAVGILIAGNAVVPSINNSGSIQATVVGPKGNAFAIADISGSLTSITNTGAISATVQPDSNDPETSPTDEITGAAIAIDARNNTTGLTITQSQSATVTTAPSITGSILLGSGGDKLDLQAGTLTGSVAFGAGADRLILNGGAKATGFFSDSDGNLGVDVNNGTLEIHNVTGDFTVPTAPVFAQNTLNMTTLHVGASGMLTTVLDPTHPTTAALNATGAVTFDAGSKLGIRFATLLPSSAFTNPLTFTILQGTTGNITGTPILDTASTSVPYLYQAAERYDAANSRILVDVNRRSASAAGMIASEAAAYDAAYAALATDTALRDAFLGQTDRTGFFNLYSQLLPEHSGAPLLSLASGMDATSRALMDRRPDAEPGETTGWVQEINFYADKKEKNAYGFRSNGFGLASGVEHGTRLGALGLSFAFTSSDMNDPSSQNDENLTARMFELGGYWRGGGQHWRTWARVAGGYAMFSSVREFYALAASIDRKARSDWDGFSGSAGMGAAYEANFGRFFVRPEASVEYFMLSEKARTETGGQFMCTPSGGGAATNCGDAFDLSIGARKGHMGTGKVMLSFGGKFGDQGWLQPEFRIGYRQNFGTNAGLTMASFQSGGGSFTLVPDDIDGGGPVVGFRILATGGMGYIALEGDAEIMDLYQRYSLMVRAGYRF